MPVEQIEKLHSALDRYPLFDPPNQNNASDLSKEAAEENFRYVMDSRSTRRVSLAEFFASFGVTLTLEDKGVEAVSAWIAEFGSALVDSPQSDAAMRTFMHFATPWIGEQRGLNVVFDLSTFFGDAVIARNSRLRWKLLRGAPSDGISVMSGLFIIGQKTGRFIDPVEMTYMRFMNIFNEHNYLPKSRWSISRPQGFLQAVIGHSR